LGDRRLRDPAVALPPGADLADEVLSVERSSTIRRAPGEVQDRVLGAEISRDEAATEIVRAFEDSASRPSSCRAYPKRSRWTTSAWSAGWLFCSLHSA
jgi:hypothetical protein